MSFGRSRYIFNENSQSFWNNAKMFPNASVQFKQSINGCKELHKRLVGFSFLAFNIKKKCLPGETMHEKREFMQIFLR